MLKQVLEAMGYVAEGTADNSDDILAAAGDVSQG